MQKVFRITAIALLTTTLGGLPASALSLNFGGNGPLVDLGNDNNADATLSIDTGSLLSRDGNDDGVSVDGDVQVNLGAMGGKGRLIDLDGKGPLLDLDGGSDNAVVNLGRVVDLDGDGPLLDLDANDGEALLNLGGASRLLAASESEGDGSDGVDTGTAADEGSEGGDVAVTADISTEVEAGGCLTLAGNELEQLAQRHAYTGATFNSWAGAQQLRVVKLNVCDGQAAEVSVTVGADANVGRLQSFLAGQAKVRAGLQSQGFAPGDVVAADQDGSVLVVYVI